MGGTIKKQGEEIMFCLTKKTQNNNFLKCKDNEVNTQLINTA